MKQKSVVQQTMIKAYAIFLQTLLKYLDPHILAFYFLAFLKSAALPVTN